MQSQQAASLRTYCQMQKLNMMAAQSRCLMPNQASMLVNTPSRGFFGGKKTETDETKTTTKEPKEQTAEEKKAEKDAEAA